MFKFLHAADIHLDSPLCGLERYPGAPIDQIRGATRYALRKLTELAIQEHAEFIVIAGDLYDGDWKDYNTGLFLVSQMSVLRETGIRVFIISGNHDATSRLTRSLRMPDNVTILSSHAPETIVLEHIGAAIHGQGFAQQACTKDLASQYPSQMPGLFNIGLLHTSISGREGHEPYAPCTVDTLKAKQYDYWALGHVHSREIVHKDPWIVFPGNTQGRHVREMGPKGCTVVTVEDGSCTAVEHRNLHVIQWEICNVNVTGEPHPDSLLDCIRTAISELAGEGGEEPLAIRLHITGRCKAHSALLSDPDKWMNEIRAQVSDATGEKVWLEKILFQTSMEIDLKQMLTRTDSLGELLRYINSLESGDALLQLAKEELEQFITKLPNELQKGNDAVTIPKGESVKSLLEDVKQQLITRLLSSEGQQ